MFATMSDPLFKTYVDSLAPIDDAKSYRPTHTMGPFLLRADAQTNHILDCRFQTQATGDDQLALQFFSHFVVGLKIEALKTLTNEMLHKEAKRYLNEDIQFKFIIETIQL